MMCPLATSLNGYASTHSARTRLKDARDQGPDYDNDSQQNEPDIVCTKVLADPHHRIRLMKEKR